MIEILFYGIRRSGNHGIINMITKSLKNSIHINNVKWNAQEYIKSSNTGNIIKGISENYTGFKNTDLVLISTEDSTDFDQKFPINLKILILLRDPYNMLASIYKSYSGRVQEYMDLWKKYAKFILSKPHGYKVIIYDKFYKSREYRKDIFDFLGLEYSELHINEKPGWAKSSFSSKSTSLDNEYNRYFHYMDDPEFSYILKDLELWELWKSICDMYEIETFYEHKFNFR